MPEGDIKSQNEDIVFLSCPFWSTYISYTSESKNNSDLNPLKQGFVLGLEYWSQSILKYKVQ